MYIQNTKKYIILRVSWLYYENFENFNWIDSNKASGLLNQGIEIINDEPTVEELHPIVISLINLLPDDEKPSGDDSVLTK